MIVQTKELKKELEYVKRFIEKKTTIPVLANVLITSECGKLTLLGTNLDLAGMTSISGESETPDVEKWSTTAPIAIIQKYLDKVADTTVRINADVKIMPPRKEKKIEWEAGKAVETEVEVIDETHHLVLSHGADSEARFDGMSPSCFPQIPIPDKIYGELRGLKKAYQRAGIAISKEESRFTLNGALLKLMADQPSLMVSTDGHRMSHFTIDSTVMEPLTTIVAKDALHEASRMNGDSCLIGFKQHKDDKGRDTCAYHLFLGHQRSIVARAPGGNFPDYERVMIKESWREMVIDAESASERLKQISVCADEQSKAVYAEIVDRKLVIKANSVTQQAKAVINTIWPDDEPWRMGFNWEYVTDFLDLASGPVTMRVPKIDENKGFVTMAAELVSQDGWRYVVMPMRI